MSDNDAVQVITQEQQWYRFIADKAGMTLWEYFVPEKKIVIHYPAVIKFGIPRIFENVPESIIPVVDEHSVADLLSMYRDINEGKKETTAELWYKNDVAQGPHCELVHYMVVKSDTAGKPLLAYGMAQDITARKLTERQTNLAVAAALDNSEEMGGIFYLNLTRDLVIGGTSKWAGGRALLQSTGYDDFLKKIRQFFVDDKELARFQEACNRMAVLKAFRNGKASQSFIFRCKSQEAGTRWVKATYIVKQNPLSNDIEVTAYVQDVHDRVMMEKVMRDLTKSVVECISIIDLGTNKYTYLSLNSAAENLVVNRSDDYDVEIQQTAAHFVVPEEREAYLKNVSLTGVLEHLTKEDSFSYDVSLNDNSGKFCRKIIHFNYLDDDCQIILVTIQDITESYLRQKKQLQQLQEVMVREGKAIESKREFLSNISHDMRTPLNGIIGFTSLALSSKSTEEIQEYLQKIKVSGGLLLDLINDTLMLSKLESGKLTPEYEIIDNRTISTRVIVPIKEAAEKKHITFIGDRSKSPQVLMKADRVNTQKIFINLLSNAIKFTPEGGEVAIIMEQLQEPMYGCNYRFIVRDNGIGMSPEFLEKMYEPFSQENVVNVENTHGTGLGLSIVKQLVELLHGHIEVKSEIGKGTEFTVFLPMPLATPEEAAAYANKSAIHTSADVWIPTDNIEQEVIETYKREEASLSRKLLLCEDNDLNTEIAVTLLQHEGYQVDRVINGKAGLDLFASSQPGEYLAILMDLRMPVMNGYEATMAIRSLAHPDAATIPIIAMSADAFEEARNKSRDVGMNAHLSKPIEPEVLFETLQKFIDSASKT